ncbi:uncharacterized protein F5147DRAFT_216548 [Suillus discolor]|uniref:Uncharacterized protein n=1 Tax=Suillus discolor TaxID=1912936 RepID=A0A9P7F638_9AGAM|nr:uncharacterized protein F5147DRAFT_216548 [Suillus discolor]KAG2106938.1 hypothetical protein F5147DRAFT_216548 [Suillus discolor]
MFQDFVLIFCSIYWRYLSLGFVMATTCVKAALYTSRIGITTQGLDAVCPSVGFVHQHFTCTFKACSVRAVFGSNTKYWLYPPISGSRKESHKH